MGYKFHIWKKKKKTGSWSGLTRVAWVTGWPARSTGFDRVVALTGFLLNPGRPGPGSTRRAGPGLKTLQ